MKALDAAHRSAAQRRLAQFERALREAGVAMAVADPAATAASTLNLAGHAALAVAFDPGFLHLLRINFFYDREALPAWVEARLLLSALCRDEDGAGLYVMDAAVRDLLLTRLAATYGPGRVGLVATLLWQYAERCTAWADRRELRHAQQLTALNFLAPDRAHDWLAQAEGGSGTDALAKDWFVAMRSELPTLPAPPREAGDPARVAEALLLLDFKAQEHAYRQAMDGEPVFYVIHGPPEHAQRWLLCKLLRRAGPTTLFDVMVDRQTRSWSWPAAAALGLPTSTAKIEVLRRLAELARTRQVAVAIHGVEHLDPDRLGSLFEQALPFSIFLVDYSGRSTEGDGPLAPGRLPPAVESRLVRLPRLAKIDTLALVDWLGGSPDSPADPRALFPASADHGAAVDVLLALHAATGGGVPQRLLEALCVRLGVRWPEVQAIAARPFAPALTDPRDIGALAREYESTRHRLSPGAARTQAMEHVVARMRTLLEGRTDLPIKAWAASHSAGERLAVTVALQLRPDRAWLEWLGECAGFEQKFIVYHALLALHEASKGLGDADLDAVTVALVRARHALGPEINSSDRGEVVRQIESVLVRRHAQVTVRPQPIVTLPGALVLPGTECTVTIESVMQIAAFTRAKRQLPFFVMLAPERPSDLLVAGFESVGTLVHDWVQASSTSVTLFGHSRAVARNIVSDSIEVFASVTPWPESTHGYDEPSSLRELRVALQVLSDLRGLPRDAEQQLFTAPDTPVLCYRLATALHQPAHEQQKLLQVDGLARLEIAQRWLVEAVEAGLPERIDLDDRLRERLAGAVEHLIGHPQQRRLLEQVVATPAGMSASQVVDAALAAGRLRALVARVLLGAPPIPRLLVLADIERKGGAPGKKKAAAAGGKRKSPATASPSAASPTDLKIWPNGSTLRVKFLAGSAKLKERVMRCAALWTWHANIVFERLPDGSKEAGDIRVSFDPEGGSWSYVGTDARAVPATEATLNLGWATLRTPEAVFRQVVLKEFGLALGLINEHQNPNHGLEWNRAVVLKEFEGPPNFWTAEQVEQNIFARVRVGGYREFDPHSVMLYNFPAAWTDRSVDVGGATDLSASDKQFIARLYPK